MSKYLFLFCFLLGSLTSFAASNSNCKGGKSAGCKDCLGRGVYEDNRWKGNKVGSYTPPSTPQMYCCAGLDIKVTTESKSVSVNGSGTNMNVITKVECIDRSPQDPTIVFCNSDSNCPAGKGCFDHTGDVLFQIDDNNPITANLNVALLLAQADFLQRLKAGTLARPLQGQTQSPHDQYYGTTVYSMTNPMDSRCNDSNLGYCDDERQDGALCTMNAHCQSYNCDPNSLTCVPKKSCRYAEEGEAANAGVLCDPSLNLFAGSDGKCSGHKEKDPPLLDAANFTLVDFTSRKAIADVTNPKADSPTCQFDLEYPGQPNIREIILIGFKTHRAMEMMFQQSKPQNTYYSDDDSEERNEYDCFWMWNTLKPELGTFSYEMRKRILADFNTQMTALDTDYKKLMALEEFNEGDVTQEKMEQNRKLKVSFLGTEMDNGKLADMLTSGEAALKLMERRNQVFMDYEEAMAKVTSMLTGRLAEKKRVLYGAGDETGIWEGWNKKMEKFKEKSNRNHKNEMWRWSGLKTKLSGGSTLQSSFEPTEAALAKDWDSLYKYIKDDVQRANIADEFEKVAIGHRKKEKEGDKSKTHKDNKGELVYRFDKDGYKVYTYSCRREFARKVKNRWPRFYKIKVKDKNNAKFDLNRKVFTDDYKNIRQYFTWILGKDPDDMIDEYSKNNNDKKMFWLGPVFPKPVSSSVAPMGYHDFGNFDDDNARRVRRKLNAGSARESLAEIRDYYVSAYRGYSASLVSPGQIFDPELVSNVLKDCPKDANINTEECAGYRAYNDQIADFAFATSLAWGLSKRNDYKGYFNEEKNPQRRLFARFNTDLNNIAAYYNFMANKYRKAVDSCIKGRSVPPPDNTTGTSGTSNASGFSGLTPPTGTDYDPKNPTQTKPVKVNPKTGKRIELKSSFGLGVGIGATGSLFDSVSGSGNKSDFSAAGLGTAGLSSSAASRVGSAGGSGDGKAPNPALEKVIKDLGQSFGKDFGKSGKASGSPAPKTNFSGGAGRGGSPFNFNTPESSQTSSEGDVTRVSDEGGAVIGGGDSSSPYGYSSGGSSGSGTSSGMSQADQEHMLDNLDRTRSQYASDEDDSLFQMLSKGYTRNLHLVLERKKEQTEPEASDLPGPVSTEGEQAP